MSEVMLPWPEPKRPDKVQPEKGRSTPHYEIQRISNDGSAGPVEVLPITRPPWAAQMGRRGFLGAGIASSVAAALLLSACNDDTSKSPPTPSPSEEYPPYPTETETSTSSPPPPDTSSGGGGLICTCNKVCTCIPVCQAHRLLDPDPMISRMAEIILLAMGLSELPYLRWAAHQAATPLRVRIEDLIDHLRCGRRLKPSDLMTTDLANAEYEPYLGSNDTVTALMAAQVLCLRALSLGTGLNGTLAERAAQALTTGYALHLQHAPSWSLWVSKPCHRPAGRTRRDCCIERSTHSD
jgi:hypothetical protein